jgi:dTDP-glucose pyrophosphorylase
MLKPGRKKHERCGSGSGSGSGLGSRTNPLTRITNKYLLPVYGNIIIFYPTRTLVNAEVQKIIIVTGGNSAGDFLKASGQRQGLLAAAPELRLPKKRGRCCYALNVAEPFSPTASAVAWCWTTTSSRTPPVLRPRPFCPNP